MWIFKPDCITTSAPLTRVDYGLSMTKAREKGAEHDHYRRGLSPERPVHRVGRHRNGRVCGTAIDPQCGRSREVLPGTGDAGSQRASRDRGHRLLLAGSSGCWQNSVWSCGSAMRRRSKPSETASRRPTGRTPDCCCDCCGKIIFLGSGYPVLRIGIYGNSSGTDIALVQMRTRIMNQLQALAMNEGQRRKKKLWSEAGRAQLEKLPLAPWASRGAERSAGAAGPDEPQHRANRSDRAGSEVARGAAAHDASGVGR